MDKEALRQYKLELEREYHQKVESVSKQFRRKLDALSVLLDETPEIVLTTATPSVFKNDGFRQPITSVLIGANEPSKAQVSIRKAVEMSVGDMTGEFTVHDLLAKIREKFPSLHNLESGDLSNPLWMLKNEGAVEQIKQGAGRTPATYKTIIKLA